MRSIHNQDEAHSFFCRGLLAGDNRLTENVSNRLPAGSCKYTNQFPLEREKA
jgi:hypothetical protein